MLVAVGVSLTAATAEAALITRKWGTYVGGAGDEYTHGITIDGAGNVYVVGDTDSTAGIATPGAHRTVAEGTDGFLIKFDPAGKKLWGTYVGGVKGDVVYAVAARGDRVVVVGASRSPGLATPGAFLETPTPFEDCGFIVGFDPDGVRQFGTYVCQDVGLYAVALGEQGQVYVAGGASGIGKGRTTPGAHQVDYGGGTLDAYLARFDTKGARVWATYYGGELSERVGQVVVGAAGELYVAGDTTSKAPFSTPGAHQSARSGPSDHFLARFDAGGVRAWGTFYGGTKDEFLPPDLAALPGGGVVLAGRTNSSNNIASPGAYQEALAGPNDAYLARFDGTGKRLWGTYHGGADEEVHVGVAADKAGNLYLKYSTSSATGVATPDAYKTELDGITDIALAKFGADGKRQWSTYYGGSNGEEEFGLAALDAGHIYIAGGTRSPDMIASPGAFDTMFDGGFDDGFLARFAEETGQACAGPGTCPSGFCVDGVCCDAACGDSADDCQVCAAGSGAVADGTCTNLGVDVSCRPGTGPCDPTEQCSGKSGTCPVDALANDGTACDGGVCEAGLCVPDEGTSSTSTGSEPGTSGGSSGSATASESATTEPVPGDSTGGPGTSTTFDPTDASGASGASSDPTDGPAGTGSDTSGGAATGGTVDDAGCGCNGAPPTPWSLLVLLLVRRRSRR